MFFNPMTGLGQLQGEIQDVRRMVNSKAERYEITSINSRLDALEHSLREICASVDEIRSRCDRLEESQMKDEP